MSTINMLVFFYILTMQNFMHHQYIVIYYVYTIIFFFCVKREYFYEDYNSIRLTSPFMASGFWFIKGLLINDQLKTQLHLCWWKKYIGAKNGQYILQNTHTHTWMVTRKKRLCQTTFLPYSSAGMVHHSSFFDVVNPSIL